MSKGAKTREEAIARLRRCPTCQRWVTTATCDSCIVDRMRAAEEAAS